MLYKPTLPLISPSALSTRRRKIADAIGPGSGGVESCYSLASALKDRPPTISAFDPAGRCLAAVLGGFQLVVLPTLRYIPKSVFLSEEARARASQTRRNLRRGKGIGAQSSSSSMGDVAACNGEGGGGGGKGERKVDGRSGVSSRLTGPVRSSNGVLGERESPIDNYYDEGLRNTDNGKADGRGDKGAGKQDSGLANGGSRVHGAHWTVSKPFTVDLEEAGVTG